MIKPIQRVCNYPKLLNSLIKASPESYCHYEELKAGSEAAKRITHKINKAQRRAENERTVRNLQSRVDDWKGIQLEHFGQLLLHDIFTVTESGIDREYYIFLFEKIILPFQEAQPQKGRKKAGKSIQKESTPTPLNVSGNMSEENTPLILEGRIFLRDVTHVLPVSATNLMSSSYPLGLWWHDEDLNCLFPHILVLNCRREEQMRRWEFMINHLIEEHASKRDIVHSTNPALRDMSGYNSNSVLPSHLEDIEEEEEDQPSSSDHSPSPSSPITPLGSSKSSSGSQQRCLQEFESAINGKPLPAVPPVIKVKVFFQEDLFIIQAPYTDYDDLVGRVSRKIRLLDLRREEAPPIQLKYRDEDGDMVSLCSTEDVQMAFEQYRPGGYISLFVT